MVKEMWVKNVSTESTHPKLETTYHWTLKHDPNLVPIHNAKPKSKLGPKSFYSFLEISSQNLGVRQ